MLGKVLTCELVDGGHQLGGEVPVKQSDSVKQTDSEDCKR